MSANKKCFVIFPFNEPYESRYEKIYKPALQEAGLKALRAGGPGVGVITEDIEKKIKGSLICFADLTEDNANVWYEVGYAYACDKKVVMICNTDERPLGKLPFDIKGRNIIGYSKATLKNKKSRLSFMADVIEDAKAKAKMAKAQKPTPVKNAIPTKKDFLKIDLPALSPRHYDEFSRHHDKNFRGDLTKNEINVLKKIIDYRIVHNHKWDSGISNHVLLQKVTSKVQFHETISKLSDKRYIEKRNALGNIDSSSEESFTITPTDKAMKFAKENNDLF